MGKTWLILDVSYLCYRVYHVMPDLTFQDIPTAVPFGFLRDLVSFQNRHQTPHTVFAFDFPPYKRKQIYPDFVKMCDAFDVPCERITEKKDVVPAIKRMLASKTAYVLDVMVPYTEHVLPMIPGGMTYKDIITKPIRNDDGSKGFGNVKVATALQALELRPSRRSFLPLHAAT